MELLATARILWGALLGSSVLFALLHFIVPAPPPSTPPPIMPILIGVVSVAVTVVGVVLPRQVLRQGFAARPPPITEEPDPDAQPDYRAQQPLRKVVRVDDAVFRGFMARFQTALILKMALAESVSIFGFMLERLGFEFRICIPFFVAGSLLIAARFPSKAAVFAMVERAAGVRVIDA
jgi:hypothetical protein